jgi:hypothetical protein
MLLVQVEVEVEGLGEVEVEVGQLLLLEPHSIKIQHIIIPLGHPAVVVPLRVRAVMGGQAQLVVYLLAGEGLVLLVFLVQHQELMAEVVEVPPVDRVAGVVVIMAVVVVVVADIVRVVMVAIQPRVLEGLVVLEFQFPSQEQWVMAEVDLV